MAVLEVSHPFVQGLGTFGRHLVTEEGDLGCPKDALRRVDDAPITLQLVEKRPYLLFVLFG
jgi:hypothetical protein